jgi:23S rRNA (uracil1939-C5)-methyltransferase
MNRYPVRRGQALRLQVQELAFGGRGVARVDGFTVFVEGGLPGQEVEATILRRRKSHAEARIDRVVRASPQEVAPVCPHFGLCGGCSLQHLDYEAQLEAKRRHVQDCLLRLGGLTDIEVEPTLASPRTLEYRNKMEFTFSTRWLTDEEQEAGAPGDRFGLGLHVRGRFNRVVNVQQCHLYPPAGSHILATVRSLAREGGFPAYSTRTHRGFWRFLVLRDGVHTGDRMVYLVTHRASPGSLEEKEIRRVADGLGTLDLGITSMVHGTATQKASTAVSEEIRTLFGEPTIRERILDLTLELGPHTFFQTNTRGAERLFTEALEQGDFSPAETVWDLYCGVGAFSLPLARRVRNVIGIEIVGSAVRAAERNAVRNGLSNVRFLAGDVRGLIRSPEMKEQPHAVVVDPPRDGVHPDVARSLIEASPSRILYISCNPATLARDMRILSEGGYHARSVRPVDMFPHTPHVECVTVLSRSEGRSVAPR